MNTEYVPGKATAEYLEKMKKRMHVEEGCIVITITNEYNIPLTRCKTLDEILAWVFHLSEKTWIEREDLRYFIRLACNENNIDVPSV